METIKKKETNRSVQTTLPRHTAIYVESFAYRCSEAHQKKRKLVSRVFRSLFLIDWMLLLLLLLKKSLMWPLNHWMRIYRCAHENGNIIYCSVDLEKWSDHVIKVSCIQQNGHQRRGYWGGRQRRGQEREHIQAEYMCECAGAQASVFFSRCVVQSTGTSQLCWCDAWHCCRQPRTFARAATTARSRMMINYIRMHFFFFFMPFFHFNFSWQLP